MNPRQFYDTVVSMRAAQQEYRQSGTPQAQAEAERLEQIVDREIRLTELKLKAREALSPFGVEIVQRPPE